MAKAIKLSPRAKEIVNLAISNMKKHPEGFCMAHWYGKDGTCGTTACLAGQLVIAAGMKPTKNGILSLASVKRTTGITIPEEWASNLYSEDGMKFLRRVTDVEHTASFILGLDLDDSDDYDAKERLFFVENWPQKFREKFKDLGDDHFNHRIIEERFDKDPKSLTPREQKQMHALLRKRAAVAIQRLRHFLKTGE